MFFLGGFFFAFFIFQADGTASRKPPTFLKLLLRKCQDEFENRSRAEKLAQKAGLVSGLVPGSEEHRKTLAAHAELKQCRAKMLGNITFIGELGKRGLLSEKVLHECIRRLCDNVTDPAFEDIECLCHLLRTVGLQLDHDKAKSYMDQYFSRMKMMRKIDTLPSRIKFMLDDVCAMDLPLLLCAVCCALCAVRCGCALWLCAEPVR